MTHLENEYLIERNSKILECSYIVFFLRKAASLCICVVRNELMFQNSRKRAKYSFIQRTVLRRGFDYPLLQKCIVINDSHFVLADPDIGTFLE